MMDPIERFNRYRLMRQRIEAVVDDLEDILRPLSKMPLITVEQEREFLALDWTQENLQKSIENLRKLERDLGAGLELINESPERMRRERRP